MRILRKEFYDREKELLLKLTDSKFISKFIDGFIIDMACTGGIITEYWEVSV